MTALQPIRDRLQPGAVPIGRVRSPPAGPGNNAARWIRRGRVNKTKVRHCTWRQGRAGQGGFCAGGARAAWARRSPCVPILCRCKELVPPMHRQAIGTRPGSERWAPAASRGELPRLKISKRHTAARAPLVNLAAAHATGRPAWQAALRISAPHVWLPAGVGRPQLPAGWGCCCSPRCRGALGPTREQAAPATALHTQCTARRPTCMGMRVLQSPQPLEAVLRCCASCQRRHPHTGARMAAETRAATSAAGGRLPRDPPPPPPPAAQRQRCRLSQLLPAAPGPPSSPGWQPRRLQ